MDLNLVVNKKHYLGFAIAEPRREHEVVINAPGNIEVLEINSCHRHEVVENAFVKKKLFGKNYKSYKWKYVPNEIEQHFCPVFIGVFNKKGKHGWGILEINSNQTQLAARIECNGHVYSNTVNICQSKEGLTQRLHFDTEVEVGSSGCSFRTSDNKSFEFEVAKGSCVTAFMERATPNRIHRLHTYGFEKILIREE